LIVADALLLLLLLLLLFLLFLLLQFCRSTFFNCAIFCVCILKIIILAGLTIHQEFGVHECSFPAAVNILAVASEGLAGGSMMACISTAMLPEAFEEGGDYAGLLTLLGFLASLFVKLTLEERHVHTSGECGAGFHEASASGISEHFLTSYPVEGDEQAIYMNGATSSSY
jgi:hypothetical protein